MSGKQKEKTTNQSQTGLRTTAAQPSQVNHWQDEQQSNAPQLTNGSPLNLPALPNTRRLRQHGAVQLQRRLGNGRAQHILRNTAVKSVNFTGLIQRSPGGGSSAANAPSSGELAWEIFSPLAIDAIRNLAPGALKLTKIGNHHKEIIDVVDKLEDSVSKLSSYSDKIKEAQLAARSEDHKFALQSLKKVSDHFRSIPDAIEIDADSLIQEAGAIVTGDMFTNMSSAVERLQTFEEIVNRTKPLRSPYARMATRLSAAEARAKASFDALGIFESELMRLAAVAVLPIYQAALFSSAQTVNGYRADAGVVLSAIRNKKEGYQRSVAASEALEAYMMGTAGAKGLEERYRSPKNAKCLSRLKQALPALKNDQEAIYGEILSYHECTFENIIDALDFLPIEDADAFFAVTGGLHDAYPDQSGTIGAKEDRYQAGLELYTALQNTRPTLQAIEAQLNPLVMRFVHKEYYFFWVDDPRSLLSNTRFTYKHSIHEMIKNVKLLPAALVSGHYFEHK